MTIILLEVCNKCPLGKVCSQDSDKLCKSCFEMAKALKIDIRIHKRKRCFKNRYSIDKVFGSICDDCPKKEECY